MIEDHAPLAFDHLGDAPGRPQVGRKAERTRALAEPTEHRPFLPRGEFAWTSWRRLGPQAGLAASAEPRLPEANGAKMNAEEVGDLLGRVSIPKTFHRQKTSSFKLGRRADCSHAASYARPFGQCMVL